ncbi:uncharacterized protein PAC_08950 [Phialocephala subalpina]|uniref:Uncharacterized protein n=1 Tax=Phialocephala subalpina TaxID=576137 RepID=A0A1L7X216_9HELO|nr:uncharacterized protein PAC_08950 [Phialocephala subalpina]
MLIFTSTPSCQADFDHRLGGCTTIRGSLYLFGNYTGPLQLPGVTRIGGSLAPYNDSTPNLTSVTADDLVEVGTLEVEGNSSNIYSPQLTVVYEQVEIRTDAAIVNASPTNGSALDINLFSLVIAPEILLRGNISSLSLPALASTTRIVNIYTNHVLNIAFSSLPSIESGLVSSNVPQRRYSIAFPVFQEAESALEIDITRRDGGKSSISIPLLSNSSTSIGISAPIRSSLSVVSTLTLNCGSTAAGWTRSTGRGAQQL